MPVAYDTYYQTENLFGEPYPELIAFFSEYPIKGKLLDLGCGQGRDAIALARMGFEVTGIDHSEVGINQLNQIAKREQLKLIGQVADIYTFEEFHDFDIILLDSMFHFARKDRQKEMTLLRKIVSQMTAGSLLLECIQDTGEKVQFLNEAIDAQNTLPRLADKKFQYQFEDKESGHTSLTNYRMIIARK